MKSRLVVVGAVGLLAGAVLMAGILKSISPGPALTQALPVRDSLEGYAEAEARSWHKELLRLSTTGEVDSASSEAASLEIYNRILELSLSRPQLLAEPDLASTVVQIVRSFVEAPEPHLPTNGLASLCLAIRWTPARLQPIVEGCERALSEYAGSTETLSVRLDPKSVVILNPTRSLSRAARRYRANPYQPESITVLATELAKAGHFQPAWQLHEELVQLNLIASAELMSELTKLKGVNHASHELPY